MPDIGTSAIMASVIVGMLAIPAASKDISGKESILDSPANFSDSGDPKNVEIRRGPEGVTKKVETAFNKFTAGYSSQNASATLENSKSELSVDRSPEKTVWNLVTSQGSLKIEQSSDKLEKTVETVDGTLKVTKKNGRTSSSFQGANKTAVLSKKKQLEKLMENKLEKARGKLNATSKTTPKEVSIGLKVNEVSPEHVIIENQASQELDLEGWKLQNNNPANYTFDKKVLEQDEELKVYSKDQEDLNVSEPDAVYGTGLSWENNGDTATLRDTENKKVESKSY